MVDPDPETKASIDTVCEFEDILPHQVTARDLRDVMEHPVTRALVLNKIRARSSPRDRFNPDGLLSGPCCVFTLVRNGFTIHIVGERHGVEGSCSPGAGSRTMEQFVRELMTNTTVFQSILVEMRLADNPGAGTILERMASMEEVYHLNSVRSMVRPCANGNTDGICRMTKIHSVDIRQSSLPVVPDWVPFPFLYSARRSLADESVRKSAESLVESLGAVSSPSHLVDMYRKCLSSAKVDYRSLLERQVSGLKYPVAQFEVDHLTRFARKVNFANLRLLQAFLSGDDQSSSNAQSAVRTLSDELFHIDAAMMDIYTLAVLFAAPERRRFEIPKSITNALVYVGAFHAKNLHAFLLSNGFAEVYANSKTENQKTRCIRLKGFARHFKS